jgi:hypothetical protein
MQDTVTFAKRQIKIKSPNVKSLPVRANLSEIDDGLLRKWFLSSPFMPQTY